MFEWNYIHFTWAIIDIIGLILSNSVFRPRVTVFHALLTVKLYLSQFHSLYLYREELAPLPEAEN